MSQRTKPANTKSRELTALRSHAMRLVGDHHELIYRVAYRELGNASDAEDVTQSTFLRLMTELARGATLTSPRGWLVRVAINGARQLRRGNQNRKRREEKWAEGRVEREEAAVHRDDEVTAAVADLPEELRLPVVLHYQEGLKYREIAEALECPEGTVARRISNARSQLRARLTAGALIVVPLNLAEALAAPSPIDVPAELVSRLAVSLDESFQTLATANVASTVTHGGAAKAVAGLPVAKTVTAAALLALLLVVIARPWERDEVTLAQRPQSEAATSSSAPAEGPGDEIAAAMPGPSVDETATVAPESPTVFGWVRDAEGRALSGVAVVAALEPSGRSVGSAVTSQDGYYEISGLPSIVANNAWRPHEGGVGAAELRRRMDELFPPVAGGASPPSPTLPRTRGAGGDELEEDASRSVDWGADRGPRSAQVAMARTTGVRVTASPWGHVPGSEGGITLGASERRRVDLSPRPAHPLRGRVVDARGIPVQGALLTVVGFVKPDGVADVAALDGALTATCDDGGNFALAALPRGDYLVRVAAPDYQETDFMLDGARYELLELPAAGTIEVRLTHAEARLPIRNAYVTVTGERNFWTQGTTDADGRVRFTELRPGRYEARVARSNLLVVEESIDVVGGEEHEMRLEIGDGVTIAGRYPDAAETSDRLRAILTPVAAPPAGPPPRASGPVGDDGAFRIIGVREGEYRLTITRSAKGSRGRVHTETAVTVRGSTGEHHVHVESEPVSLATIEIDVVSEARAPIENATVVVTRRPAATESHWSQSDGDGAVDLEVYPGRYHIRASSRGRISFEDEVEVVSGGELRVLATLRPSAASDAPIDYRLFEERFAGAPSLIVKSRMSLRSLLELIDRAVGDALRVDPAIPADRLNAWSRGAFHGPPQAALIAEVTQNGLRLEDRDGVVWLTVAP